MKKTLLFAMVAMVFMACGNGGNGAELPQQDQKALEVATATSVDLIGAEKAKVQKAYTDAGYIKVSADPAGLQKRVAAKAPKKLKADATDEEIYVYGLPKAQSEMTEAEALAYLNKLYAEGKSYSMVQVTYKEGVLNSTLTVYTVGKTKKVNTYYTAVSDVMYSKKPNNQQSQWQGAIVSDEAQFEDHAAYVAKVAASDAVKAEEMCYGVIKYDYSSITGYYYMCAWDNPNAEEEAAMAQAGYTTPYVLGYFMIYDINEML